MNAVSSTQAMTALEKRAVFGLAGIMSLRMLGLFMILPVFALYAENLDGVTPILVGMAIGIYGLTQACFQIPFGMLSDRFGRKPVITIGLFIFAIGSVVAATSDSITGVIIGRALQGSGAIAAAILALTADLTREDHRTQAMAMLGMTIGMAFLLALAVGPILNHWIGVAGIFWFTAMLALVAIAVLYGFIPDPPVCRLHRDAESVPTQFIRVLGDWQLLRLDMGILILHFTLTATFVVLPLSLRDVLVPEQHWWVYLLVLLLSISAALPFIIIGEKKKQLKEIFIIAIAILGVAQFLLGWMSSLLGLIFGLLLYFFAFNLLEALLPSLVSKLAHAGSKGTAMGVYSTSQFFGAFLGGVGGGFLHHHYSDFTLFMVCTLLVGLWFIFAVTMQPLRYLTNYLLNIGQLSQGQAHALNQRLLQITGVAEAVVIIEEQVAYLKVDRNLLDVNALDLAIAEVNRS
ncbi:MFS transporter [Thioflexithrix psekupsensis]|uniref:MFS transporter n=1 Tax=Thioflexithrix psekupsensis TaxID=1570016 RepID=A0A251XC27_9GAMM|nr:MFS transporter [Thioflexithrix psekupsensis]OUD15640.1 MFS transporter [Thioflexithrix psekupsensis]